jgi:hypothetical protein
MQYTHVQEGPGLQLGRRWMFKNDQVTAWVDAGDAASHITDEKVD